MSTLEITGRKGTYAVRRLRKEKLKMGLPFMINVKELSSNQCYLEYPNGSIKLVTVLHASREINVIRELSSIEATQLRERLLYSTVE